MRRFASYLIWILAFVVLASYALDFIFTQSYYSGAPRNKVSWVKSGNLPDSLDYGLFGSSRCIHNISPGHIEELTGLKGLNLGCDAAGPIEIKLMVQEVLSRTFMKKIYIQVDTKYDLHAPDEFGEVIWMPFIKEDQIYSEFVSHGDKYKRYRHLPFYRYQLLAPEIGYRNVLTFYRWKKGNFMSNNGYVPIYGKKNSHSDFYDSLSGQRNPVFDELIDLCNSYGAEVYFFTAPIYSSKVDFSPLEKELPNYTDFSQAVSEMEMYLNATHLNHSGAVAFTKIFTEYYYPNRIHDTD